MKTLNIIILFLVVNLSSKLLAQSYSIPIFDQVTGIDFLSNRGWMLDLWPDGSGKLTYGSTFGDYAEIPSKTFYFQDVYNLLVPLLLEKPKENKTIAICMRVKNKTTKTFYLEDKDTIKKIMSKAQEKMIPLSPEHFNELLKKYPLIPDESTNNSVK